jgi:anti-anti-sigma factor
MTLNITMTDRDVATKYIALEGRLDTVTSPEFDEQITPVLASSLTILIFDLADLTYISSAGLRSIFRARKTIEGRGGALLLVNVQPQVQKVFDIVKALPSQAVFKSVAELDQYLDYMQRKQ